MSSIDIPVVLCGVGLVSWLLLNIFIDPLRHVPGSPFARWTSLALKIRTLRGERSAYIHALHEKFGPIVRLGPKEVSTIELQSVREIYRVGSPFPKSKWYQSFVGATKLKTFPIFSMINSKEHAQHRRVQAFNFTEKWIKNLEPQITRNVDMTVAGMKAETESQGCVDVLKWFTFMAGDVVGEAAFGENFGLLKSGKKCQYTEDLENSANRGVFVAELPFWFNFLIACLPFGYATEAKKQAMRVAIHGMQAIGRYRKQLALDPENVKPTLLTNEYRLVDEGTVSEEQLNRDAMGTIVAGTDTTSVTATYLIWSLTRHPAVQAQIIAEVEKLPIECTDEDIRKVELFGHVLNETLRLYGAASASMPRDVPASGIQICGRHIPGGTTISTQAYSLHRIADIWENFDTFDPSRWESPTKEMKDAFMPWGGGSRVCLGMHFAQVEIRRAIVNFYRTFPRGVEPAFESGFNAAEMDQESFFLMRPKGRRCLLRPL